MTELATPKPTARDLCERIRADEALVDVEGIAALGDRFVGAEGDRAAAAYVREAFEEFGLEVVEREFDTRGYRVDHAELRLAASGMSFEAVPAYYSPGTDGPVAGELVFAEGGAEEDYEGLDVAGKVVLIQEAGLGYGRFWMGTFAAFAARRGAVAVIVVHPLPWPYRMAMEAGNGDLANEFLDDQVPVVSVSAIDGLRLARALGAGDAVVELDVGASSPPVVATNLSGILRGGELAQERLVVHAHRDHAILPGANDNGSGVATMLALARALAPETPPRSIEFLCTTAEEATTRGAFEYVAAQTAQGEIGQIRAAIDLDMFGTGGKLKLVEVGHWPDTAPQVHSEWLMRVVEGAAEGLGYEIGRMTSGWGVAESGRFLEAGVPAIWFWKPDDFYYHSREDGVEKLDGNALKVVGEIAVTALWQLAHAAELPRDIEG